LNPKKKKPHENFLCFSFNPRNQLFLYNNNNNNRSYELLHSTDFNNNNNNNKSHQNRKPKEYKQTNKTPSHQTREDKLLRTKLGRKKKAEKNEEN